MTKIIEHRGKIAAGAGVGGTLIVVTTLLQILLPGGLSDIFRHNDAEAVTRPQLETTLKNYPTWSEADTLIARRGAERNRAIDRRLDDIDGKLEIIITHLISKGDK